ncbi:extracellular solute-binding protein [Paenibacillus sp.]
MKKSLSLVLALVMLLSLALPAYAEVTGKGELPIVTEPITLRVAFVVSSKVEDMETNRLTLWIEEQTGINLEFIELSSKDTATQVNALMNGNDLPDVIWGYNLPYDMLCAYADAGLIVPLDEQFEKYGKNVYDVIVADLGPNTLSYMTYDGHIYAVPSGGLAVTNKYNAYTNVLQTAFLDELGMEHPQTLDDLYKYLVGVRDNDVNKNGDPNDEIPMTTWAEENFAFKTISQAYQYTDEKTYLKTNDGKISFIANNELFKEAIEFTKKLVDEKLLDPACFTQDESVISTINAQEGNTVGLMACGYFYTSVFDANSEEYSTLRGLPTLEGPHGYKSSAVKLANPNVAMVVTSACKNVDAAFRLADFMLSDENSLIARIGFEGEQWKKAEEGVIGRNGKQAVFSLITTQEWVQPSTNVIWNRETFIHSNVMDGCEAAVANSKYSMPEDTWTFNIPGFVTNEHLPELIMNVDDATEYEELQKMIVDYVNTSIAQFVLGDRSLDDWDNYCKDLEKMGVERYLEIAQVSYDAMQ